MAHFVQEYAALRWSVVGAFLVASVIVVGRLAAPARWGVGMCGGWLTTGNSVRGSEFGAERVVARDGRRREAAHQESDAAHLLMCLVMLAMLVFPSTADPAALRGVLVAMAVVFGALMVSRIMEWRNGSRDQIVAIGYHLLAAGAMLYAMSGHSAAGHSGPAPALAYGLAALFLLDALAVVVTGGRHWLGHPAGSALSSALVPHVVMDLGTAYMLIGAVLT
ncbi:DUF5134 domain-containing protein [Nocardia sp. NPDC051832]|uniref:DUF5134 domain-containing protein n=1 Tax=Nocardia sp. NPDC051832 TaxID=3155673 RepID=UPI0034357B86